MPLVQVNCPYDTLTPEEQAACVALMVPRYRGLTYPTEAELIAALAATPGTAAFAAKLADLDRRIGDALGTFADSHAVSAIFARTITGDLVAVAVMRTIRGTSQALLSDLIGSPSSSIPTHRVLQGFRYPAHPDLVADETPERALAEFGRLVVANHAQLQPLIADGTLTPGEADHILRHGFDALLAGSYFRDQATLDPPRAYIFNAKPRLAHVLAAGKGLTILPLFADGAEPTPTVLDRSKFDAPYFQRWAVELGELVPTEVLEAGLPVAIRHLTSNGFNGWRKLGINLPYLILCDRATARGMTHLATIAAIPTRWETPLAIR